MKYVGYGLMIGLTSFLLGCIDSSDRSLSSILNADAPSQGNVAATSSKTPNSSNSPTPLLSPTAVPNPTVPSPVPSGISKPPVPVPAPTPVSTPKPPVPMPAPTPVSTPKPPAPTPIPTPTPKPTPSGGGGAGDAETAGKLIPEGIGIVQWGGTYAGAAAGQNFRDASLALVNKGFQTFKIPISIKDLTTLMGITHLQYTELNFMSVVVSDSRIAALLESPQVKNVVLSVYDAIVTGLGGQGHGFTNPTFLQQRQSDIVSAYEDLTLTLMRTYKNTGKTFVLSTWETENSLYCGGAYGFQTDSNFRANCLTNYANSYGVASPKEAFQAIATWFSYRAQGVKAGLAQAQAEGITGVQVQTGIEFNAIHMVHNLGYPTVLYDLFPNNKDYFDTLMYSSYESINSGTLIVDWSTILSQASGHPVGISEWGFYMGGTWSVQGVRYTETQMMQRTTQDILTLLQKGQMSYAIIWQGFNAPGDSQLFAMYDSHGVPNSMMQAVYKVLGL